MRAEMKFKALLLATTIVALCLVAPASAAIGPASSSLVTDPVITSANYDYATQTLSLSWTLGTATNGGFGLDLGYQTLDASVSPSTIGGTLTYPFTVPGLPTWVSDDQTRYATSFSKQVALAPGTYYVQLMNAGSVMECLLGDCKTFGPYPDSYNNYSPVASFTVTPPPPPPPPQPPPPPSPTPHAKCVVPKVVGTSLARAKRKLSAAHCRSGSVGYRHSRVGRGVVYWQNRKPGTRLPAGTQIRLLVSLGR
jgi:hypothetical protein